MDMKGSSAGVGSSKRDANIAKTGGQGSKRVMKEGGKGSIKKSPELQERPSLQDAVSTIILEC